MSWDLKMKEVYDAVVIGPDQAERDTIFTALVGLHTQDKSKLNLHVGVQGDAKFGDNWESLDPNDKRDCIDHRVPLEACGLPSDHYDLIVCNAVLEHVRDPFGCAREIHRILKPGGQAWIEVPFVHPYHPYKGWELEHGVFADPLDASADNDHGGDYWRFSPMGVIELMKPLRLIGRILLIGQGGVVFHGQK